MSEEQSTALNLITTALKLPGVKVERNAFLLETFAVNPKTKLPLTPQEKMRLLELGPISSGIATPREVKKLAEELCNKRVLSSTVASFTMGLPGGLAMAATIPSDVAQFYGFTLRIAQEIAYLYDKNDLWKDGILDENEVRGELLLYLGTMLGVGGTAALLRYVVVVN